MIMRTINGWMKDPLCDALGKTKTVVLTKRHKYLEVIIDSNMSFGEQIRRTADKTTRGFASLGRLMGNVI